MRYALLLLLVPAVSGCGARGFAKPGADYPEFYSDLRQCIAETQPQWQSCFGYGCGAQQAQNEKHRNQCMRARGWVLTRRGERFAP